MTSHEYHFEDTIVNPEDLLPSTVTALEKYDKEYEISRLSYFARLSEKIDFLQTGENEVPFALIGGGFNNSSYSGKEAVLWQNPWASPIIPGFAPSEYVELATGQAERSKGFDTNSLGKLVMADLAYGAIQEAGIMDDCGKPIPVIAVASPSKDWSLRRGDRNDLLEELSRHTLQVARELGYTTLHLAGTSMGSSVMGELLHEVDLAEPDIEIKSLLLSEMPSFADRGLFDFGKRYVFDTRGLNITGNWTDQGPQARRELAADGQETYDGANVYGYGNALTNFRAVNAMRQDRLNDVFELVKEMNLPITIEAGDASKVSQGIWEFLDRMELVDESTPYDYERLQALRATGCAPHAHTENSVYMADVITRSVLFAKENA